VYEGVKPEDAGSILDALGKPPVERLAADPGAPFFSRQKKIVLENSGVIDPERIEEYIAAGGFEALNKALTQMTPQEVIQEMITSGLRGARRRRLPHRPQVEHGGESRRRKEIRDLQRG
jgi:bidirectional [NiFe] hydrogenase diaphorase subunit